MSTQQNTKSGTLKIGNKNCFNDTELQRLTHSNRDEDNRTSLINLIGNVLI